MKPWIVYSLAGAAVLGAAVWNILPLRPATTGLPVAAPAQATAPQCAEHSIAEADCPWCNPVLIKERGQCGEHGVPEALCSRCRPALVAGFKAQGDWCAEHSLPESQCTQCNPAVAARPAEPTPGGDLPAAIAVVQDAAAPRSQTPPSVTCQTQTLRVQFPRADIASRAGLEYERIGRHEVAAVVTCTAELAYDGNHHACIRSPVSGVVSVAAKDLGARVQRGDILAVVESAELGQAKAAVLKLADSLPILDRKAEQARNLFRRQNDIEVRLAAVDYLEARALLDVAQRFLVMEQRLSEAKANSAKDLIEAQAAQQTAELRVLALQSRLEVFGVPAAVIASLDWAQSQRLEGHGSTSEQEALAAEIERETARADLGAARGLLRSFGLSDGEVDASTARRDVSNALPVTAPCDGEVVARRAVVGELVGPTDVLFETADPSRLWAMLDVYEADMARVRAGQPVIIAVDACRGEPRGGQISWVASVLDLRTRTLKARAEVANPDGLLRAGMFGKAVVTVAPRTGTLMVPTSAVQWEGCCNIAFVRRSDVLFEPRKLRLGVATDRHHVVVDGLSEGDVVVTTGSFLLKTEILKGSIGAGCCEVEPGKR